MGEEELTQNEYNALSNSEKFSGKLFFIIDQGYIYKNDVIYGGTSNSGKLFKNGVQYGRNSHARIYKNGIEYAIGIIVVEVPTVTVGTYTYNGSAQGPTITGLDSEHCTVTNATKTSPGTYTMTISLNDTDSCIWSDDTTTPKTYQYTINKVSIVIPTFSNMSYVYDGAAHSPTITYNSTYCNISGNGSRTNAGSQTVTVSLKDTTITQWTDGTTTNKTATFTIEKADFNLSISGINFYTPSSDYTGQPCKLLNPSGGLIANEYCNFRQTGFNVYFNNLDDAFQISKIILRSEDVSQWTYSEAKDYIDYIDFTFGTYTTNTTSYVAVRGYKGLYADSNYNIYATEYGFTNNRLKTFIDSRKASNTICSYNTIVFIPKNSNYKEYKYTFSGTRVIAAYKGA